MSTNILKYTIAAMVLSLFIPFTAKGDGHFTELVEAKNEGVTFNLGVSARGAASFGGSDENEFVNIDNVRVELGIETDYGQVTWTLPTVTSKYASVNGFGRLNGVAVYGDVNLPIPKIPVMFDYSVGVFQGVENDNIGEDDEALIAARVSTDVSISDVDISLGFAGQHQNDYFGWNIDGSASKFIPGEVAGTATVSGGYYNYDLDGSAYTPGTDLNEGDGFYVQVVYTLDHAFNVTDSISLSPEPFFRYQRFNFDGANDGNQERFDAGVNFVINAETNTKLTVNYWHDELLDTKDDGVIVGLQFVF